MNMAENRSERSHAHGRRHAKGSRAGIKPATWRSYVHRGQAPPARGGTATMPLWEDTEVKLFLAHRPGPGTRTDLHR